MLRVYREKWFTRFSHFLFLSPGSYFPMNTRELGWQATVGGFYVRCANHTLAIHIREEQREKEKEGKKDEKAFVSCVRIHIALVKLGAKAI